MAAAKQSTAVDGGSSSYCDRQSLSRLGKPARAGKPPAAGGGGRAAKWQGWRLAPAHPTAPTCSIHLSKSMPPRRRPRAATAQRRVAAAAAPGCCGCLGALTAPAMSPGDGRAQPAGQARLGERFWALQRPKTSCVERTDQRNAATRAWAPALHSRRALTAAAPAVDGNQ